METFPISYSFYGRETYNLPFLEVSFGSWEGETTQEIMMQPSLGIRKRRVKEGRKEGGREKEWRKGKVWENLGVREKLLEQKMDRMREEVDGKEGRTEGGTKKVGRKEEVKIKNNGVRCNKRKRKREKERERERERERLLVHDRHISRKLAVSFARTR